MEKKHDQGEAKEGLLLGLTGAAELLGVSYWCMRSLCLRGEIPFIRIGRRIYVDKRDILDWVDRSKETGC